MYIPGLAEGYCLLGSGVDFERRVSGLDESEGDVFCLRLWERPPSDVDERTEPTEDQRSREEPTCEDSIDDTRERGGEPTVEDGAETDLVHGKRGLKNFEENDFLGAGRDWMEEVDGLRPMTRGRGGGGTELGVDGMDSSISGPRESSYSPSSKAPSGSGTTGSGANLIFLWVGLESSSEGRMETLGAGELGRNLDEVGGEVLRRIDCRVGFAMALDGVLEEAWRRRRRRRRSSYTHTSET